MHGNAITQHLRRCSRDDESGCRIWTGRRNHAGYGVFSSGGRPVFAHRAAWEAERGPIPKGLCCLHNCPAGDNPACINVEHLWLGTRRENNADRDAKNRQVAPQGEAHGCARLDADQVAAIRRDARPYREIAQTYALSETHVGEIKRGANWTHLPGAESRKRGAKHCHAKLTEQYIRDIRADSRTVRAIAAAYGISNQNVSLIKRGLAWRHVQ